MGTLFLIDAHTPVLLNSEINDTIPVEFGEVQTLNGSFPINVPFGVPIDGTPADLTELLTKKFTGLLAFYPGYTNIDYDEGIDDSGWDAVNTTGASIGSRGATNVNFFGLMQSTFTALSSTPSEAILTWEVYEITSAVVDNDKDGVRLRQYEGKDASELSVQVTFNGGSSWFSGITDGVQFSIAPFNQGSSFGIRFWNNTYGNRLWVGSWAVVY